jgi:hypothetical protein
MAGQVKLVISIVKLTGDDITKEEASSHYGDINSYFETLDKEGYKLVYSNYETVTLVNGEKTLKAVHVFERK